MKFILLVLFLNNSTGIMQEFDSSNSCNTAKEFYIKQSRTEVRAICTPK